jgi:hypothetical protein
MATAHLSPPKKKKKRKKKKKQRGSHSRCGAEEKKTILFRIGDPP